MSETDQCRCGHPKGHHDANECWTTADGLETFEETSCTCSGYALAQCRHKDVKKLATLDGTVFHACLDCDLTWAVAP